MASVPKPFKGKDTPKKPLSPMPPDPALKAKIKGPDAYSTGALEDAETGTTTTRYAD